MIIIIIICMRHGGITDMKVTGKKHWLVISILTLVFMTACGTTANEETPVADKQHVVKTIKGDISIPVSPKRVVGNTVTYPDLLYALDVIPVAAENYHEQFPSYFQDAFKDTVKLGNNKGPNYERLLAATPDLIIAPVWRDENNYDQLSQISPTVLLPARDNWRDELRDIAEVLGIPKKAEEVIHNYESKTEELKKQLHALIGNETVIYMRITPKGSVIAGPLSDRGKVIHGELGLKPIEAIPKDEAFLNVSIEMLPEYNPDHIILQVDSGGDGEQAKKAYEDMAGNSLWKSLKAVKNDHVYMVGDNEWFNFGFSPIANIYAIDQIMSKFEKNK